MKRQPRVSDAFWRYTDHWRCPTCGSGAAGAQITAVMCSSGHPKVAMRPVEALPSLLVVEGRQAA